MTVNAPGAANAASRLAATVFAIVLGIDNPIASW
jgi:hypothetical protein